MEKEFLEKVVKIESYRGYNYRLCDIVKVTILGLFCGLKTIKEIHFWSAQEIVLRFLQENFSVIRIPCYSHFTVMLSLISSENLNKIFMEHFGEILRNGANKTIAIDGKTVCATANMSHLTKPLHIASAYATELGITIGQLATEDKSNEIKAVQNLIKLLDVSGSLVVADALNCQKKTAKLIIKGGGDYLLAVKKNHKNLYEDIAEMIAFKENDVYEKRNSPLEKVQETEKTHGRFEKRQAVVTHDVQWLEKRDKWINLQTIGAVRTEKETRYYISSRKLTADELLYFSRNEWQIEKMHWQLDVILGEDRCLARDTNVQKTLNILRKTVLNFLSIYKTNSNLKQPMSNIMFENLVNLDSFKQHLKNMLACGCF